MWLVLFNMVVLFLLDMYKAFVVLKFYAYFITPVFAMLPAMSFWQMFGVSFFWGTFTLPFSANKHEEAEGWEITMKAVLYAITLSFMWLVGWIVWYNFI